jgi:hypothetical protein
MSQQSINIGTNPNDGTGDALRTAFSKCNSNFTDLYTNSYATNVVNSFNSRVGAVTLTSNDVTTALTYTPLNKAGDTATGLMIFNQGWVAGATGTNNLNVALLTAIPAATSGTILRAIQIDGTTGRMLVDSFVNAGNPGSAFTVRGARGTGAAPAAVQSTDIIGAVSAHGYGATMFQPSSTGLIAFIADGATFTDSSQPTSISFQVAPSGSVTKQEVMRVTGSSATPYINIPATTASTSATTGALVIAGGLGVSGNVNYGSSSILYAQGGTRYQIFTTSTGVTLTQLQRYCIVATGGLTITLPNAAGSGLQGQIFTIKNNASLSGNTTVTSAGGNIDGTSSATLTGTLAHGNYISDGSNWWSV